MFRLDLAPGRVTRLSFHEAPDRPQGVIGSDALFVSRRHEGWDRMSGVYRVPLAGSTETLQR